MAITTVRVLNPETGNVGDLDINRLHEAVMHGAQVAQPLEMFNPETGGTGTVDPEKVGPALQAGALPVGSHAHKVATTSKLESFGRGALQSLTGGFADEISGAVESALGPKKYAQARDESRANFADAAQANPVTSGLGELAGGLASFAVPGMGAIGKGIPGAIATGAKLGTIYGAGNSTAEDLGGVAKDALTGGAAGGFTGGALGTAGKVLGFVGGKATEALGKGFEPKLQRLLAMGAKANDLLDPKNSRVLRAVPELEQLGVFARDEAGKLPSAELMADRLEAVRVQTADQMNQLLSKGSNVRLNTYDDIITKITNEVDPIIKNAPPSIRDQLADKTLGVLQDIDNTGGSLTELWQVKKNTGRWVGRAWDQVATRTPDEKLIYEKINAVLGDSLEAATEKLAQQSNMPGLAKLNSQYAAIANTQGMLAKSIAAEHVSTNPLGVKFTDVAGGGLAATAGGALGGSAGAGIGYATATLGNAALRSTQGRLLRAEVGAAVKQQKDKLAIAAGAIPRTVDGVKQWVSQHLPFIQQQAPQMAGMAQQILNEPPALAEQTIRIAMPMLTGLMTPSPYPSEFQGRALEPQDRFKIEKQMRTMPGITTSQLAAMRSRLNKDGTIDPSVYAPGPAGNLDASIDEFSARLQAMGY